MATEPEVNQLPAIVEKQRWQIDSVRRQKALDRQMAIACGEDDEASPRDQIAAFRSILVAEAQNQNDEQHTDNRVDEGRNRILDLLGRGGTSPRVVVVDEPGKELFDESNRKTPSRIAAGKNKRGKPRKT